MSKFYLRVIPSLGTMETSAFQTPLALRVCLSADPKIAGRCRNLGSWVREVSSSPLGLR